MALKFSWILSICSFRPPKDSKHFSIVSWLTVGASRIMNLLPQLCSKSPHKPEFWLTTETLNASVGSAHCGAQQLPRFPTRLA